MGARDSGGGGEGAEYTVHGVSVQAVDALDVAEYDAVVLVTAPDMQPPATLKAFLADALQFDSGLNQKCGVLRCELVSGGRLVVSPTGELTPYHDVRSIYEASMAGVQRALSAGSVRPILALPSHSRWQRSELVALLGAMEVIYVPLQIRETFPAQAHKMSALGVWGAQSRAPVDKLLKDAVAIEVARGVTRDIGGGDPERMAPPRVAEYVRGVFANTSVRVRVVDDPATLCSEYPLFAAVDRAAATVPRHRGCVIFMEYEPASYERTVMLVGKGVTYDTGGCDIKAGGVMAGMSRDKCGAAAVVGFMQLCASVKPNIKALGVIGVARNSVGEEAYVADELMKSRSGLAVRVGNTDAEGRMLMADLLTEMADRAAKEKSPHIYTIATLTGHAHRAVGDGYSIVMDNHAATHTQHAHKFQAAGDSVADMVEVSTLRREDLAAHRGQVPGDQVHQADNKPSTAIPRGHQGPAGFLLLTSGLCSGSVPYSHLDVAASAGSLPHPPTAAPLLALAAHYGLISAYQ